MTTYIDDPLDPAPPEILPGLLPRHGHLSLIAETNVGKTLVALEILESVLSGRPLWGQLKPTDTYTRGTYITGEYDENYIKQLWQKIRGTTPEKAIVLLPRLTLVTAGQLVVENFKRYKDLCAGSQVVVFDPLSAFVVGTDIENDASLTRAAITAMLEVAGNNSVIIPAHMGKPQYNPKDHAYFQRTSYAARGSSSIEDTPMACFYLKKSESSVFPNQLFYLKNRKVKFGGVDGYQLLRDDETLRHTLVNSKVLAGLAGARARWGPTEE